MASFGPAEILIEKKRKLWQSTACLFKKKNDPLPGTPSEKLNLIKIKFNLLCHIFNAILF